MADELSERSAVDRLRPRPEAVLAPLHGSGVTGFTAALPPATRRTLALACDRTSVSPPEDSDMRQGLFAGMLVLAVALGGAWWYFAGREYVVRVSEAEIHQQLDKRLPLKRSFLLVFEAELAHPRVRLRDGSDRVDLGLDVVLNLRVGHESRPLGGRVDLVTGLRYDAADGGFHLVDPVITRLDLQGVPAEYQARATRVVDAALAEFVGRYPVYTLRPSDAKRATARLLLKSVVVSGNELVLTLGF